METLYFSYSGGSQPWLDCFYFGLIHVDTVFGKNITQKIDLGRKDFMVFELAKELLSS